MQIRSYNICLVIGSLGMGGAERSIAELANFLVLHNHSVAIITLIKRDHFFELNSKIRLIEPSFYSLDSTSNKIVLGLKTIFYLRKAITTLNPDVIYSVAFPTLFLISTIGLKYPIVISIRCNPLNHKLIDPFPLFVKRIVFRRATGIIAQTEFAASQIKKMTNHSNIAVIPNFLREIEDVKVEKKKYIINVGRFIKEKGHKYLLEAFSLIPSNGWKLLFVGDGRLRESLVNFAENLNISDRVIFLGEKNNVDYYLRQSEIFVFSSISEGFPNALLEAMAIPLPCISFDCDSGPSEIIHDSVDGFLVKPKDVVTLAAKMAQLMNNEELRDKFMKNAIKVRENFQMDKIANKYFQFLIANIDTVK